MSSTPLKLSLALAGLLSLSACSRIENIFNKDDGEPSSEVDADGDGYTEDEDCDDGDATVHPDADEICDGVDNNCDGVADETSTYYADNDGDGHGNPAHSVDECGAPSGYVMSSDDCNDNANTVYPGAPEICDELDNDCDGLVDLDDPDATGSGTWYRDNDSDGYGSGSGMETCERPEGWVSSDGDCDDGNPNINPGESEVCDGLDNDCDGGVDVDAIDASYGYADNDGDGFGDPGAYTLQCDGADNDIDCDDGNPREPQAVDASGTSYGDGSLDNPYDSIQDGIDNATMCVAVFPGTYRENIDFGGNDVLVASTAGPDSTIINGQSNGAAVTFSSGEGAGAELRGFTVRNGSGYESVTSESYSCGSSSTCTDYYYSSCGGGLYVDGARPTLTDLQITSSNLTTPADSSGTTGDTYYYSFGGGVCVRNTSLTMTDVDVWDNYAEEGGGIYVEDSATLNLNQSYVGGNTSENGAGIQVDGGTLNVENVAIVFNDASVSGGGIYANDASLTVVNTTIGESEGATGGGIMLDGSSSATVRNSIVYGADDGVGVQVASGSSYNGAYSNVYGNTDGQYNGTSNPTGSNGNISQDPKFNSITDNGNASDDDWGLKASSPSVDAGDPSASYKDADGTTNDQGAFGGPDGNWN